MVQNFKDEDIQTQAKIQLAEELEVRHVHAWDRMPTSSALVHTP